MSVGALFHRLARVIGITMIFSVVGPIAFAALILLIIAGLGAPILQLVLAFVGLKALGTMVSIAALLLAVATVLASFPPSAVAGLIFALAAVYAGKNALWVAWLAVAIAIIGVIVSGTILEESSAAMLPDAGQVLVAFAMLAVLAILPTTLCWWLTKPLSRAILPA
ncbi:hypothetical protein SAMN05444159_2779 [Bradyrhizobium lablabi]|uniref:Uncharacterized protein n=1 Tax=Bradyrhizobium lablabi TaxID=722472 RepID=A0A1M6QT42_9BRAD|nr:hypothetical protein [Bradyrhizobium lablabi]SHK23421.1 hypothetical protein SAMN05444159_2779 [Bradyrhizobium lablabi]